MNIDPSELSPNELVEKRTKELQASEARLRSLIEQNVDGIVIVAKNGRIRFVNPAAERLFRRSVQELVGTNLGFSIAAGVTREIELAGQKR